MAEGSILKERYKILHSVGTGGMSEVYLAEDLLLNRYVALKVLRPQFADDKAFLEQFKREAQSAARLSHPSIINIFDVCEDVDKSFIVMEYVEGKTMKEILESNGAFQPFGAVHICCELAAALGHAHKRNIVHCDIKPHNILLTEQMMPKIADFGIARMISNMTMVYTNSVVGSVHYLSPEQAAGRPITVQSDIYSLGIVLYEMLTGKVPFDGNTAVSVAMMHIEKEPPALATYVSGLPEELQGIIDKALAKNLEDRYASADEMLQDLVNLKNKMLADESQENYAQLQSFITTDNDVQHEKSEVSDETIVMRVGSSRPAGDFDVNDKQKNRGKKMTDRHRKIIVVGAIFLAGIFLLIGNMLSRKTLEVPELVGKSVVEAQQTLKDMGFRVVLVEEKNENVLPGQVLSQHPNGKTARKEGSIVELVISRGLEMIEVPDLIGKKYEEARELIISKGFNVGEITNVYQKGKRGEIIEQTPAPNTPKLAGDKVDIVIAEEARERIIPEIKGISASIAKTKLERMGFRNIKIVNVNSSKLAGTILVVEPKAGEKVMTSTEILLKVANGADTKEEKKYVEFKVPEGRDEQNIKIVIVDDEGTKTVYEEKKDGGVRVRHSVKVLGPATAMIYSDNKLIEEKEL